jgi:regulation of enolase protein 1 (concanavalin A-like superfamily)
MDAFTLPSIPGELAWQNRPLEWKVDPADGLSILAGAATDWFADPKGGGLQDNAPCALFQPDAKDFLLSARVTVEFRSTFDAGVLQMRAREDTWGKLCFEYSPQGKPTIVSVVTRGVSDDCNSTPVEGNSIRLRASRDGATFAFHYSLDGKYWHLVRYFSLGAVETVQAGFSAQSPTGKGCHAVFSEISYRRGTLADIRNGE